MLATPKFLGVTFLFFFAILLAESHENTEIGSSTKLDRNPDSNYFSVSYSPVNVGQFVPYTDPKTGEIKKKQATVKDAYELNEKLALQKSQLENFVKDPALIAKGFSDYVFTHKVELVVLGSSHSGETISINAAFVNNADELLAVFVHEQLHNIAHNIKNDVASNRAIDLITQKFEEKVPNFATKLNAGSVPGVNPRNKGCLPPKPVQSCTSEHSLVNWLEMKVMARLWGKEKAEQFYLSIIEDHDIYSGIYEWLRIDQNSKIVEEAITEAGLKIPY